MRLYKILKKVEDEYYSPFQNHCYGTLEQLLNKEFICEDFDSSDKECSEGFYATDIQGLIYANLSNTKVVFEVEMSGENIKFSDYKWRWQKQTFVREISIEEIKELVRGESNKMDWNYYNMLFPKNPLEVKVVVMDKHKLLLQQWASVGASVGDSVRDSVWDSVGDSVWASVWASVGDSVRDSVWDSVWASVGDSVWASVRDSVWDSVGDSVRAYISSAFPNIKKWKYIDHKEGINPFQSGIDLWNENLIPSFDGKIRRLHSGPKADIVFEITQEELRNSTF
jgi:hypothetical protein